VYALRSVAFHSGSKPGSRNGDVALAGVRLETRFVVQVAPRVIRTDLIGAAGDANDVTTIGEVQFVVRLAFERFRRGKAL